jgi:hypothetical protein
MFKPYPNQSLGAIVLLLACMTFSCEKDVVEPAQIVDEDATTPRAVYSSRSVNFDNRSDGTYTTAEVIEDFGNISGWNESRAYNSAGTCRITMLKNALSGAGGVVSTVDITDGSKYWVTYQFKFHSQFDWSRGGKIGFGFGFGDGNAGCDPAWDGNGASVRTMWYNNNGFVYIYPYVYYRDMPGTCGDNFGIQYGISRSTWYTVSFYVESNTGSNYNGRLEMKINGNVVMDKRDIRWTTNDAKRLVNRLWFMTFRGGSQSYWMSPTDGYIYYDNVSFSRLG